MTLVVGTAGHIDHGKTTLLHALTGIDADRLPEERRRGMTIDVGYAHLTLPDGSAIDFVDVPGHDRLVGNMLVGAGEIDAAMLVVSADDGPRAQTDEHLALLDALRIDRGIAIITKADLVDDTRLDEVTGSVRDRLRGTSLASAPILAVCAVTGAGLDGLRDALDRLVTGAVADSAPATPSDRATPVRLAIDRVFAIRGRGVVATGTLRGGRLSKGAILRVVPGERDVRVREVQVHGRAVAAAGPGRTALNLAAIDAEDLHRGDVLTDDPAVVASDRALVMLAAPLADRARARLHLGTAAEETVVGRSGRDAVDLTDGSTVAMLRLTSPIAMAAGDRFVLRRSSGHGRVTGGLILDAHPARGVSRRRQTPDRLERLASAIRAVGPPRKPIPVDVAAEMAAARLDLHGVVADRPGHPAASPEIERLADAAMTTAAEAAGSGGLPLVTARAVAARAIRRAATATAATAEALAAEAVSRLEADGHLVRDGTRVRAAGIAAPAPDIDGPLAAAMARLETALAMPAPPALSAAARSAGCPPDGIRALVQADRIVILEPDLAYAMSAYRDLAATALALAAREPLTPAAYRDATGTSRRYVLAILEDLDRRGLLRRTAAGHVLGPRAPRSSGGGTPAPPDHPDAVTTDR